MADQDHSTPIGTTPLNLDPETQRAIVYALEAQSIALSRVRAALDHLAKADSVLDDMDDIVLDGAQAAEDIASKAREWLGCALFGTPDPVTGSGAPSRTVWSVFNEISDGEAAASVVRLVEGHDEQEQAA